VILETNALSPVADDEPAGVRLCCQAASMELPAIVLDIYGTRSMRLRSL
jgi:hypothetical protein